MTNQAMQAKYGPLMGYATQEPITNQTTQTNPAFGHHRSGGSYGPLKTGPEPACGGPAPPSPSESLTGRFDAAVKDLCCTITDLERRLEATVATTASRLGEAAGTPMMDTSYASPLLRRLDELVGAVEGQIAIMQRLLGRLEI